MSHTVHLTVAPDEVYLGLGGRRDVMLTVHNAGSRVAHYRLDIRGIPAAWYDLDQPRVALPATASAHVHLAVHLPAGATSTAGRYPITVQVTSEDDPAHRASAGFVLTVGSGSALDMDVRPEEAAGRDATFHLAFLNQSPAPAVVALAACDSTDALCVHIEPPDPVVVPTGATAVLATVHVSPKVRGTRGRPQRYEIEFRARAAPRTVAAAGVAAAAACVDPCSHAHPAARAPAPGLPGDTAHCRAACRAHTGSTNRGATSIRGTGEGRWCVRALHSELYAGPSTAIAPLYARLAHTQRASCDAERPASGGTRSPRTLSPPGQHDVSTRGA